MPPFSGQNTKLIIPIGSEFIQGYRWQVDGQPQSFAGYTPKAQIRTSFGGLLILDISPYITLDAGGVQGRLLIMIPASVTKAITTAATSNFPAKWDLKLLAASPDDDIRFMQGDVVFDPAVTD